MEAWVEGIGTLVTPVGAAVAATVRPAGVGVGWSGQPPTMAVTVSGATALMVERGVRMAMPDGASLATDVLRPQTSAPLPALLVRTPYGRDPTGSTDEANALALVEAGYAIVVQDCRGRYGSDGSFDPFRDEAADGEATIAWLADQPWCGRVGMLGGSYVGATQWLAAARAPQALAAFAPYVTAADYHEGWTYQGGAFQLGFTLRWALGSLGSRISKAGTAPTRRRWSACGRPTGASTRCIAVGR